MFAASACFVTMSALVKALGHELPLSELMVLRCLIAIPVLFGLLLHGGHPHYEQKNHHLLDRL